MRIPINLASEPFRRDRPMLVASGACAVLLAVLLGVLMFLIVAERGRDAGDTRVAVDRLNAQLRDMTAEQAKLDAMLRQPANAEVLRAQPAAEHAGRAQVGQLDPDFRRSGSRDAATTCG